MSAFRINKGGLDTVNWGGGLEDAEGESEVLDNSIGRRRLNAPEDLSRE